MFASTDVGREVVPEAAQVEGQSAARLDIGLEEGWGCRSGLAQSFSACSHLSEPLPVPLPVLLALPFGDAFPTLPAAFQHHSVVVGFARAFR